MGKKRHSVNLMFTVLLLGLFEMTAIFVAVLGAQVYAHSADKLQANFDTRTSVIYLSEKIHTSQGVSHVSMRSLDGVGDALVLSEKIGNSVYESWIFVKDGMLCESVVSEGGTVLPSAAQQIMPLANLSADVSQDGVTISVITESGQETSTFVSRRADG